jgi:hypothetical protein
LDCRGLEEDQSINSRDVEAILDGHVMEGYVVCNNFGCILFIFGRVAQSVFVMIKGKPSSLFCNTRTVI